MARFGQAVKPPNPSQQLSKASTPHMQQLSKRPAGFAMVPPYWPQKASKSCFYWASKLPRGTFWAGLKTPKTLAAAFEGLSTAQPSAAALEASCWLCHGASLLAPQAVSIGLRNCRVARFGQALKPSKPSQQLSKAAAPHNPPQHASRAAAEGCAVLRPSKAAARVLGVLRPAQNVPRGSFEAQ